MTNEAGRLAIWNSLLASAAEEMGITLGLTAHSPNIRERRDYSCGVFDSEGRMVAQAAHIPVHLGAMPEAVRAVQALAPWRPGDIAILNDPFLGGTHLPDVSLVAPVFFRGGLAGFVSNRAHHADIGGMSAGSMPVATELVQEGVIIPPLRLVNGGVFNHELFALILRNTRTPDERRGDFEAQLAALRTGEQRLVSLCERYGPAVVHDMMDELLRYTERITRAAIQDIPDGEAHAEDALEGPAGELFPIRVRIRVAGSELEVDFAGTSPEQDVSLNAVAAVTRSAVGYCVRCLLPRGVPANEGSARPISVLLPEGSLVHARSGRAVSAGNVETSQRITDVVFAALRQLLPRTIPAASAGTMSNLTFGGRGPGGEPFAYYETIPGGAGGGPRGDGLGGVQTHMTNTANTPVEAVESVLPVRIRRFELRDGSGGHGVHGGGDGVVKEVEFLVDADVTLIANRHITAPQGVDGGEDGSRGHAAILFPDGTKRTLAPLSHNRLHAGETLRIETPGGGGWGQLPDPT